MTGWRLGWCVVPEALVPALERLAQNYFLCASAPAQHAAQSCFTPESLAVCEARRVEFAERRALVLDGLARIGLPVPVPPDGAFYVYFDVSQTGLTSCQFCERALQEAHVALTPGRDFGVHTAETHVRLSYAASADELREGDRPAREVRGHASVGRRSAVIAHGRVEEGAEFPDHGRQGAYVLFGPGDEDRPFQGADHERGEPTGPVLGHAHVDQCPGHRPSPDGERGRRGFPCGHGGLRPVHRTDRPRRHRLAHPVNVIQLLIGTQVLQGLISPVVLVYLLVLTNRRALLGPAANSPRYRIAATTVVVGVAAMSTILLVETVLGRPGLA